MYFGFSPANHGNLFCPKNSFFVQLVQVICLVEKQVKDKYHFAIKQYG